MPERVYIIDPTQETDFNAAALNPYDPDATWHFKSLNFALQDGNLWDSGDAEYGDLGQMPVGLACKAGGDCGFVQLEDGLLNPLTATNYLRIFAASGDEHDGIVGSGVGAWSSWLATSQAHVIVEDMRFWIKTTTDDLLVPSGMIVSVDNSGEATCRRCIIEMDAAVDPLVDGSTWTAGFENKDIGGSGLMRCENCIAVGKFIDGAFVTGNGSPVEWLNCTGVNKYSNDPTPQGQLAVGISAFTGGQIKNCVAMQINPHANAGSALSVFGGTPSLATNATSDVSGDIANIVAATEFADPDNGDYTLKSTSQLMDAGTNLTSDGVTTDIIGTARPQGSAFDIGVFEASVYESEEVLVYTRSIYPASVFPARVFQDEVYGPEFAD